MFCALSKQNVFGPFFFAGHTVTGIVYLDMFEEFLMPILEEGPDDTLFQQDRAPPHFHKKLMNFLNSKFLEKCIGRGRPVTWPPRLPDLTPVL
jgi:hypothetical protein